jgi:hypothetical protein
MKTRCLMQERRPVLARCAPVWSRPSRRRVAAAAPEEPSGEFRVRNGVPPKRPRASGGTVHGGKTLRVDGNTLVEPRVTGQHLPFPVGNARSSAGPTARRECARARLRVDDLHARATLRAMPAAPHFGNEVQRLRYDCLRIAARASADRPGTRRDVVCALGAPTQDVVSPVEERAADD